MIKTMPQIIFVLGLTAGAGAAVVVALDAPDYDQAAEVPETTDFDALIQIAFNDYEANDARTEGAPQQQVVNGWIARDMLRILASQQEAQADTLDVIARTQAASTSDERSVRLVLILTLIVAWIGAWAAAAWRPRAAATSIALLTSTAPSETSLQRDLPFGADRGDAEEPPSIP